MGNDKVIAPLLYIDQPHMDTPLAYMQHSYHGSKQEAEEEVSNGEADERQQEQEEKSFDLLSVQEQIDYLVNVPAEVPPLKCVIYTTEGNFQGIIIAQDETTVTIKRLGRLDTVVDKEDIKRIKLIGF